MALPGEYAMEGFERIYFEWDGREYSIPNGMVGDLIVLPDARVLHVTNGWLESQPPKPNGLEEVHLALTEKSPNVLAAALGAHVATEVVRPIEPEACEMRAVKTRSLFRYYLTRVTYLTKGGKMVQIGYNGFQEFDSMEEYAKTVNADVVAMEVVWFAGGRIATWCHRHISRSIPMRRVVVKEITLGNWPN